MTNTNEMADFLTRDELIKTRAEYSLPDSADSWNEAGRPIERDLLVTICESGELRLGQIAYVTRDGWAGVVLAGETRCDEWPAERLAVD